MTNFVKYLTVEGIEFLNISEVAVTENISNHLGSINSTNYENTYYMTGTLNLGEIEIFKECDGYYYFSPFQMIITKEPIDFKGKDSIILNISDKQSDTIVNFLGLEGIPYINVGDVNPFEYGFVLVSKNIDYDVIQVDICPDTQRYIYRHSSVDGDAIQDEYGVFDVDIDDSIYEFYVKDELDIPLFFNNI